MAFIFSRRRHRNKKCCRKTYGYFYFNFALVNSRGEYGSVLVRKVDGRNNLNGIARLQQDCAVHMRFY